MLGLLFAFLGTIGYSCNNIINKKLVGDISEWNALLISSFFLTFFSAIMVFFLSSFKQSFTLDIVLYSLLGGLIGMIALLSLFKSFFYLNLGETMTIANIFPFFTLLFVYIFHGDSVSLFSFLFMLVVFLGIYLIFLKEGKFIINRYVAFPFLTALGWGFYHFSIDNLLRLGVDVYNIVFYLESLIFIFTLFYFILNPKIKLDKTTFRIKNVSLAFFSGLSATVAMIFLTLSMIYLIPPIVSSIISAQVMLIALLSYFIYGEKLKKNQIFGIFIVFIGIVGFNILG